MNVPSPAWLTATRRMVLDRSPVMPCCRGWLRTWAWRWGPEISSFLMIGDSSPVIPMYNFNNVCIYIYLYIMGLSYYIGQKSDDSWHFMTHNFQQNGIMIPNVKHTVQRGWNHQPARALQRFNIKTWRPLAWSPVLNMTWVLKIDWHGFWMCV